MPNATVPLSSVGTSPPVNTNWRGGGPITAGVTLGSTTMTVDFTMQFTLSDLQMSSSPAWQGLSSAVGSSTITHYSSALADAGLVLSFLNPVAGLRLSSTAISA